MEQMRFTSLCYPFASLIMATSFALCSSASPLDQAPIATYGEWEVTGEVDADGRIAYQATLHDHSDERRIIQLKCWPSAPDRGFTFFLFDEAIRDTKSESMLVTFNNSHLGTVDQFEGAVGAGYVDVSRLFLELVGCGRCNPPTGPHDGPLLIAIQNRKMEFKPSEADAAWGEIARRCHL
jgi:hypothetical protein